MISAIAGTAGVGKTALAVHWAHRVRRPVPRRAAVREPARLRPRRAVLDPAEAVRGFLDALGVPPERDPGRPGRAGGLYRSLLAGRRMLVVLDNARDAEQVRPLLPGAPGCLVLVTSRNRLTGLVAADGAHPLTAGPAHRRRGPRPAGPPPRRRTGSRPNPARSTRSSPAAPGCRWRWPSSPPAPPPSPSAPARRAGRASSPTPAAGWTRSPATTPPPTCGPCSPGPTSTLTADAARLFRLLGLHPGPDISAAAAASLAGLPVGAGTAAAGRADPRAPAHRAHAPAGTPSTTCCAPTPPSSPHHRARDDRAPRRHRPDARPLPAHRPRRRPAAEPAPRPDRSRRARSAASPRSSLADRAAALAWFTAEHPVLLAAVEHAADAGFDTPHLAAGLDPRRPSSTGAGTGTTWPPPSSAALAAADRLGRPRRRRRTPTATSPGAYIRLGRHDDAHTHLRHALDLYRQRRRPAGQAHTHHHLGLRVGAAGPPPRGARPRPAGPRPVPGRRPPAGQANALNAVGWYHARSATTSRPSPTASRPSPCSRRLGDRDGPGRHLGQPRLRPPPPRPPHPGRRLLPARPRPVPRPRRPLQRGRHPHPPRRHPPRRRRHRRRPRRLAAGPDHPRRARPPRRRHGPRQTRRSRRHSPPRNRQDIQATPGGDPGVAAARYSRARPARTSDSAGDGRPQPRREGSTVIDAKAAPCCWPRSACGRCGR